MPIPTPTQTLARIERAHAAWTRGGATLSISNTTSQGTARAQFRLDLDGAGGATLRISSPAHGKFDRTDQAFNLRGSTLTGVDYVARETLRRPETTPVPLGPRLIATLGGVDDAVAFLLTTPGRERYLKPFRALTGWKATAQGLERRTSGAGKASLTRLELDPSGRLRTLHVELPGSRLDWAFAYGPYRPFSLPSGLARVASFTVRPRPPRYADDAARTVVERMLKSGGRLQSAIVRIDGAATLWIGGSRARYEAGGTGFAYDGRTLTVATPGAAYQGRSTRGAVIDYAASLLGDVDPLVRSVLVRTPPYAELFAPDAKVRVVGTMASAGQTCDVVEVDSPRYRSSLFVRKADGLPVSIETEVFNGNGAVVHRTTRSLAWTSVGSPLPRALFALRLRQGQTLLPLPKRRI